MAALICEAISCPYWSNSAKRSYGCQRYGNSSGCHLLMAHPDLNSRNEYALYGALIDGLRQENEAFFLEDSKYQEDVEFQESNSDWFDKGAFKVRKINV